jgi:hypothetical protein
MLSISKLRKEAGLRAPGERVVRPGHDCGPPRQATATPGLKHSPNERVSGWGLAGLRPPDERGRAGRPLTALPLARTDRCAARSCTAPCACMPGCTAVVRPPRRFLQDLERAPGSQNVKHFPSFVQDLELCGGYLPTLETFLAAGEAGQGTRTRVRVKRRANTHRPAHRAGGWTRYRAHA